MAALRTHFATLDAANDYLINEGFEEVISGMWLSSCLGISADVETNEHGFTVVYFG